MKDALDSLQKGNCRTKANIFFVFVRKDLDILFLRKKFGLNSKMEKFTLNCCRLTRTYFHIALILTRTFNSLSINSDRCFVSFSNVSGIPKRSSSHNKQNNRISTDAFQRQIS